MTVYVDRAVHRYRRMIMCHMVAPDVDELHAMADRIGVDRLWFQDPRVMPVSRPHYDIAKVKRALAIHHGAVEVDRYQMVAVSRWAAARYWGRSDISPLDPFRRTGHSRLPEIEAWLIEQGWSPAQ